MAYNMDEIGQGVEKLTKKVVGLTEAVEEKVEDSAKETHKEDCMGDIAGLLALMQGNKNLDLPGLIALAKERGYDRGWGGEGMFMFVFLILFLYAGGGWNNLGARGQAAFAEAAGASCQTLVDIVDRISGVKDRIADAQATNAQSFQALTASGNAGFQMLDTKLCTAIAEVLAAVRDQGDRSVAATQSVKDQLFTCCCEVKGKIDDVLGRVDALYGHTSLLQERTANAMSQMECRLNEKIGKLSADMALGFERAQCDRHNIVKDAIIADQAKEITELKARVSGNVIADRAADNLKSFMLNLYTPTRTPTNPVA